MAELGEGDEMVGTGIVYGLCRGFNGDQYCASCCGGIDGEEVVRDLLGL